MKKKTIKKNKYNNTNKNFKTNVSSEIISIVSIALSIFFAIAIFVPSRGGFIGSFLGSTLRSLFGIGTYSIPFIIILSSIYILFNKQKEILLNKIIMCTSLFLLTITFFHIISVNTQQEYTTFNILVNNFDSLLVINGGLIGALIGNMILAIFGKIGAYIIILSSIIILAVILTGRSFISLVINSFYDIKNFLIRFLKHNYHNKNIDDDNSPPMYLHEEDLSFNKIKDKKQKVQLIHEELMLNQQIIPEPLNDIKIKGMDLENEKFNNDKNNPIREEVFINTSSKLNEENLTDTNEFSVDSIVDKNIDYVFPSIELLGQSPSSSYSVSKSQILENSQKLEETLKSFGVLAKVIEVSKGPTVTRYELSPGVGVKVSKISGLADDLALSLAANGIRIEAPIPGKSAVGIEVPNAESKPVYFREVIESDTFKNFPSKLAFALGKDIAGNVVVSDIAKMPHLLIAGATGSGKSVCINTLVVSIIYKSSPEEVKLIMIDPKVVELSVYNGIPHLMIPVVTDPKKAAGALNWAVKEMLNRYELFATTNVRDLKGYNEVIKTQKQPPLPQIVIIIDELADLMMASPGEVEDSICRLAQMARAAGIHLIIATQRPSVDVITGVIKANVPSRLAFSVSSGIDSRTILDSVGAEKLLGRGDMLFCPIGMNKPIRIQGAFITDKEVESIVEFLKAQTHKTYDQEVIDTITSSSKTLDINEDTDELFEQAVEFVIQKEKASASLLQRQFRIGYNRASRLIESLETQGIVGPEDGSKPRKVLMTNTEWQNLKQGNINQQSDSNL